MKCHKNKTVTLTLLCFLAALNLFSQEYLYPGEPPEALTYQAEVRDSKGDPVKNTSFVVNATILLGPSTSNDIQWTREYEPVITDKYGMFTIVLSDDPNGSTTEFADIEWWAGPHSLQIELIDDKGNEYDLPVTQFLSVPYALSAGSADYNDLLNKPTTVSDAGITDAVTTTGDHTLEGDISFENDILVNGLTVGKGNGSGDYNTALGVRALSSNDIGTFNTAIGASALFSNTIGRLNTAIGHNALFFNTMGSSNTAYGIQTLFSNETGFGNSAIGNYALQSNTEGFLNTATGNKALIGNTTGNYNTANGNSALLSNTEGSSNTAVGENAGYSNKTGNSNVFLGADAGYYETGSNKLFIDTKKRDSEADGRTESLIYGVFANDPTNQVLTINGNVGIGTISPESELDVEGDINFTGILFQDGNPFNIEDADADPANELQNWSTLPGIPEEIANGDDVDDADHDPTNEIQDLSGLALKSNVLELNNTTPFTPDADYEPATKEYVDDKVADEKTYTVGLDWEVGGYVVWVSSNGKHGLVARTVDLSEELSYDIVQLFIDRLLNYTNESQFNDWRLPTLWEANLMYEKKDLIGGFSNNGYWTSSPASSYEEGKLLNFLNGNTRLVEKMNSHKVRTVRTF